MLTLVCNVPVSVMLRVCSQEAADVGTLFPRMGVEPADITKLSGKTVKPGSSCTVQ